MKLSTAPSSDYVPISKFSLFLDEVFTAAPLGQSEVDKIVHPALLDSSFRELFLERVHNYGWCVELCSSVFTAPVFDKECVKLLLDVSLKQGRIETLGLSNLVKRPEFDNELFCSAVSGFCQSSASEAIRFLFWMEDKESLSLELLLELYCSVDDSKFSMPKRVTLLNNRVWKGSVASFLVNRVGYYYPELPEAWVRQMLNSLREVDEL